MPTRQEAIKFLSPQWFGLPLSLGGLSLAWQRATPFMGEMATGVAMALGMLTALLFLILCFLFVVRWQHFKSTVETDLNHPVRHPFFAAIPASLTLLITCGMQILGVHDWLTALWWIGSVVQIGVTLWILRRWLNTGTARKPGWGALTPGLLIPVIGHLMAPLAGRALGIGDWSAAQFGLGVLLGLIITTLLMARLVVHGAWSDRWVPATFFLMAPPAIVGSAALQFGAGLTVTWMFWGMAFFLLLWCLQAAQRMLKQPFSILFWSLGFPLSAFAVLTLRLAMQQPIAVAPAMILLALATLLTVLLIIATWKGLRDGSLLKPESVTLMAVSHNDS